MRAGPRSAHAQEDRQRAPKPTPRARRAARQQAHLESECIRILAFPVRALAAGAEGYRVLERLQASSREIRSRRFLSWHSFRFGKVNRRQRTQSWSRTDRSMLQVV